MENASKALIMAGAILIAILLISIGLILVNSGKGVTDSGVTAAETMKIQTFNSQFTPYEGERTGTEIRELFSKVKASNAIDPEHYVALIWSGNGTEISSSSSFKATDKWKVELSYADGTSGYYNKPTEKGYIYVIVIVSST